MFAPVSELYGRQIAYISSQIFYVLFTLGTGFTQRFVLWMAIDNWKRQTDQGVTYSMTALIILRLWVANFEYVWRFLKLQFQFLRMFCFSSAISRCGDLRWCEHDSLLEWSRIALTSYLDVPTTWKRQAHIIVCSRADCTPFWSHTPNHYDWLIHFCRAGPSLATW